MKQVQIIFLFFFIYPLTCIKVDPELESLAIALYKSGKDEIGFHCIGGFILRHAVLTACTCIGKFAGNFFVPHDIDKITIMDLKFNEYTPIVSITPHLCKKTKEGEELIEGDVGCWITKEDVGLPLEYIKTAMGRLIQDCNIFVSLNKKKLSFVRLNSRRVLNCPVCPGTYCKDNTNLLNLIERGSKNCYSYEAGVGMEINHTTIKGSLVVCDSELAGVVSFGEPGLFVWTYLQIDMIMGFLMEVKEYNKIAAYQMKNKFDSSTGSTLNECLVIPMLIVFLTTINEKN